MCCSLVGGSVAARLPSMSDDVDAADAADDDVAHGVGDVLADMLRFIMTVTTTTQRR